MSNATYKYSFWLTFTPGASAPRCTRNMPAIAVDERAMFCTVELPRSLFTRPQLTATITVNEVPSEPMNINVEAAETALSEVLGASVVFTVTPPSTPEPEAE